MITIKSEKLNQLKYLADLLEEDLSDKKTEATTCYAIYGNDELPVITPPIEEKKVSKKVKADKKKSKVKNKEEVLKEPSLEVSDHTIASETENIEQPIEQPPVDPTPILRLTPGIFAGYHRDASPLSIYFAYQSDVYYDFTKESNIESILRSNWIPSEEEWKLAASALQMINKYGITKYNEYPHLPENFVKSSNIHNILLVDQPVDDHTVLTGSANEQTFNDMLLYAFDNFPYSTIYVKLHPDTIDGKKEGYLKRLLDKHQLADHPSIVLIDQHCNITSFFNFVQEVFVVTSQVGFEALLRGKSVTCFGMPFYAGWGLTNDMQVLTYAKPKRTLIDLFIVLAIQHCLYLNPFTKKKGTILDFLEYISLQQRHSNKKDILFYNSHFSDCKNIDLLLDLKGKKPVSLNNPRKFKKYYDCLVIADNKKDYQAVTANKCKHSAFMADGFLFSSFGSPKEPLSLIIDYNGPYYDPKAYSDLEYLLSNENFTEHEKKLSEHFLDSLRVTYAQKARLEEVGNLAAIKRDAGSKKIIFVPGQAEDDDLTFVGGHMAINNDYHFLKTICEQNENSFIVYKPHHNHKTKTNSEVSKEGIISLNAIAGQKKNKLVIEDNASISHCIDYCTEVHINNHDCGLEAIIKGKKVITYGNPFYSGYGLTEDKQHSLRPKRNLTVHELALGTYMLYPRYKVPEHEGFVNAFTALEYVKLKNEPTSLINQTGLSSLFKKIKSLF